VIDRSGIIRAADLNADYTIRPEPSETVRQLRALSAALQTSEIGSELPAMTGVDC